MFANLNYYSVIWLLLILALAVGLALFWRKPRLPELLAFGGIFAAILGLYFYLRPVQSDLMGEAANVQAMIGQGTPVLLEFQSPYCVACVALKPAIDSIESEFDGKLIVLRINVQEQVGMQLASFIDFSIPQLLSILMAGA